MNPMFLPSMEPTAKTGSLSMPSCEIPVVEGEFWTSGQRQASCIHEVSYRACFKPQLPKYFIERHSLPGDVVYDPFAGRGTMAVEAALLGRNVVSNDINPLGRIFCLPRLEAPPLAEIKKRLASIPALEDIGCEIDLSMFYHPETLKELLSLRAYLLERRGSGSEDAFDRWIAMVATNRLTGHSPGFFSVYTLPPNQATSQKRQLMINERLGQAPEYRDVKKLVLKKSESLLSGLDAAALENLRRAARKALLLSNPASSTPEIGDSSVALVVTSPPFLDIVQYAQDNWLRCWFNGIDAEAVAKRITMKRGVEDWRREMAAAFRELYRVVRPGGRVAFEVGEVRKGSVRLEEHVAEIGIEAGFACESILINSQSFTKTSNIWGVSNNARGTNSNRIALFVKP